MLLRRLMLSAIGVLMTTTSSTLAAQQTKRYVAGVVADSLGNPIAYASVLLNGTTTAVTRADGTFRIDTPERGAFTLGVRRIGFRPFAGEFTAPVDSLLRIVIGWVVKTLEPVEVAAHSFSSLEIHGFYSRMAERQQARNSGYFITPEDIEVRQPSLASHMLYGMPTIAVTMLPWKRPPVWIVRGQDGCIGNVYVNGTRMNLLTGSKTREEESVAFDEIVPVAQLAGIEVYTRGTHAPTKYQGLNGSCAVVLIWTK